MGSVWRRRRISHPPRLVHAVAVLPRRAVAAQIAIAAIVLIATAEAGVASETIVNETAAFTAVVTAAAARGALRLLAARRVSGTADQVRDAEAANEIGLELEADRPSLQWLLHLLRSARQRHLRRRLPTRSCRSLLSAVCCVSLMLRRGPGLLMWRTRATTFPPSPRLSRAHPRLHPPCRMQLQGFLLPTILSVRCALGGILLWAP